MHLIPIGYFLRQTKIPLDWDLSSTVTEACTVSHCMNPSPHDWIKLWRHNDLGFFNTQADAWSMPVDSPHEHHLFAYRLLPVRFDRGHQKLVALPELSVEALSEEFVSLGFDVVNRSELEFPSDAPWSRVSETSPGCAPLHFQAFFGCSPLSCNGLSKEFAVNQFCLLNTLAEAEAFAEYCSREEPEPGPYYVVEVLRESDPSPEIWE